MDVIKVLATETACNSTPQTFGGNKLIRLFNSNTTTVAVITRTYANTTVAGTFSLNALATVACAKDASDTLTSTISIPAVPVSFAN